MKTINDNPEDFFENGGWSFLEPNSEVTKTFYYYKLSLTKYAEVFILTCGKFFKIFYLPDEKLKMSVSLTLTRKLRKFITSDNF